MWCHTDSTHWLLCRVDTCDTVSSSCPEYSNPRGAQEAVWWLLYSPDPPPACPRTPPAPTTTYHYTEWFSKTSTRLHLLPPGIFFSRSKEDTLGNTHSVHLDFVFLAPAKFLPLNRNKDRLGFNDFVQFFL